MEIYRELTLSHKFWRVQYDDGIVKTIRVMKGDNIKPYIRTPMQKMKLF
jgi:hypothetical protein